MDRLRAPPLLLFAVTSLAMHLAALGLLRGPGAVPAPTFDGASVALSGDTLEVDPAPPASPDPGEDEHQGASAPAAAALEKTPTTSARGRSAPSPTVGDSGSVPLGLYGAAGTRYATDLATTLTRAFPDAASAEPLWFDAPIGSAGTADLAIVLDDDGHISDTSIAGAPSIALRRGIERTLSLLMPRPFTAHGRVTRLRVTGHVSRDDHLFAINRGSFSGDVGSAYFTLPPHEGAAGRRVDVVLRLLP